MTRWVRSSDLSAVTMPLFGALDVEDHRVVALRPGSRRSRCDLALDRIEQLPLPLARAAAAPGPASPAVCCWSPAPSAWPRGCVGLSMHRLLLEVGGGGIERRLELLHLDPGGLDLPGERSTRPGRTRASRLSMAWALTKRPCGGRLRCWRLRRRQVNGDPGSTTSSHASPVTAPDANSDKNLLMSGLHPRLRRNCPA